MSCLFQAELFGWNQYCCQSKKVMKLAFKYCNRNCLSSFSLIKVFREKVTLEIMNSCEFFYSPGIFTVHMIENAVPYLGLN